jgi:phosphonate degradation associated HDIG domain protein
MSADDAVQIIADLFASEGATEYLGEPVTQASHLLQAAALAERERAEDALIAAALLHDVGHFAGALTGHDLMRGTDTRHGEAGAAWLAQWFGDEVTEPVRLHVAAKRYLCAVEPGYAAALSPASVYTLGVQGGPMQDAELAEFEANRYAAAAVRVRRWDDAAKDPEARPPALDHFASVLRALARR